MDAKSFLFWMHYGSFRGSVGWFQPLAVRRESFHHRVVRYKIFSLVNNYLVKKYASKYLHVALKILEKLYNIYRLAQFVLNQTHGCLFKLELQGKRPPPV